MSPAPISTNPFPGLRPFRTDEDYLFFGREGQSEEILRRLRLNRFVAVVGTSGSGKSSLIRAGLLPYLFGGFMSGAGSHWRVAILRPGSDPIGNLAHALNDPAVIGKPDDDEETARRNAVLLEVALRRSGLGLIETARSSKLKERENLLVVVDQFEEIFRYAGAASSVRKEEDAAALVKLLLEASRQNQLPIYTAITMRSDFIGDCARFRDLPEAVTAGLYLIPRMTRDQRRAAIEGPARVGSATIERRLVNRLLNDGGDDPDQLPSLQHALMRTWAYWSERHADERPIDVEDYLAVGGIEDALSRHAEEAFAELPDERSHAIAKRLFQSLTEKGPDNREVRRPTKLGDIAAMAAAQVKEVAAVVEYFRREGRSFLTPPSDVPLDSESVIDISHESLIRGWNRLRTWVEEEYESAKMYRRLAETATLWAQGNAALWHDPDLSNALRWKAVENPTAAWAKCYDPGFAEAMAFLEESRRARDHAAAERELNRKKRLRNVRLFAATVTVMFIVASAAAIYAFFERGRAVQSATQAQKERDAAQQARRLAEANRRTAEINQKMATTNQDMALGFASSTVRGLFEVPDFVLSQWEVQDRFESLLSEAGTVHHSVLERERNNFQALIMRVNAQTAMTKLHVFSGREDAAKKECAQQEKDARDLETKDADSARRIVSAYLLARVAYMRIELKQTDRALADVRHAVQVADQARSEMDEKHADWEPQPLRSVKIVYAAGGHIEDQYGDMKAALRNYRKAVDLITTQEERSLARNKQLLDGRAHEALLLDMRALASLEMKAGQKDASAATYARALGLAKKWDKKNAQVTDELFWLHNERGDQHRQAKKYEEAALDYKAAAKLAGTLDPNTTGAQYDSACAEDRLGTLDHDVANAEKDPARKQQLLLSAKEHHEAALAKLQVMEKARGKNPGVEYNIGIIEGHLGWDLVGLSKPADARTHYTGSVTAYRLAADVQQSDAYRSSAALGYRILGAFEKQESNWDDAIDSYTNAIQYEMRLLRPDENSRQVILSDYLQLADANVQDGEQDDALKAYREGIETAESWPEDVKRAPTLVKDVVALYLGRGDLWARKKTYDKAHADYDSAARHAGALDAASIDGMFARSQVSEHRGNTLTNQASLETVAARQRDLYIRAKTCFEETQKLRREILGSGETPEAYQNLGIAENNLGLNADHLGDWEGARRHFAASADAYSGASRLRPGEQFQQNVEQAQLYLALVDVVRGKDRLSRGNEAEGQQAFQSARMAAGRSWAKYDGRRIRAIIEQNIGQAWRDAGNSTRNQPHAQSFLRHALETDEQALQLWEAVAAQKKDVEQYVASAEKDVSLDYMYLNEVDAAKRNLEASGRTYLAAKPGTEGIRTAANNYGDFAAIESQRGNNSVARWGYEKQIDLLRPLVQNARANANDKDRLAYALGIRAWLNVLLGEPWAAVADAEQAYLLNPSHIPIGVNRADAYLAIGQADRARELYLEMVSDSTCERCKIEILHDISEMQAHPELKIDPKLLASLQDELKRAKPRQKTAAESAASKP